VPTGIEEAAATAIVKKGIATVGNSALRWLSLGPRERLFRILFVEFGEAVAMPKDEFFAFATDDELCRLTDELIAGQRQPDDGTAELIAQRIAPRLHRVAEKDRTAMAREIGAFAVFSYTAALKTPEELGHNVAAKVDLYGTQATAMLTDIRSDVKRLTSARDVETDLVAALMSSPLEHAGQAQTVAAAQRLAADGQYAEAAKRFLEAADGLDGTGLTGVGDTYRLLAAEQLKASRDIAKAISLAAATMSARLDRGSADVLITADRIRGLDGPEWLVDAFSACTDWPRQPWASQRLRHALSEDDDAARCERWRAALTQISAVGGDGAGVLTDIPDTLSPLQSGHRLYWELDRIDALEATDDSAAADLAWDAVEHWAATSPTSKAQGLGWQRRGYLLARRGDTEGARKAYRRAMVAWARVEGHNEQVGDCLLSLQAAESKLGVWDLDLTARSLAFSLETSYPTPAGDARGLQDRAASHRIAGNFRDAHREYWLAFAAYKRCGSLQGVLHVSRQIAELYVATSHAADALASLITAGDEKEAVNVAKQLSAVDINEAVGSLVGRAGPTWERVVVYQLLQVLGTGADTDTVAVVAEHLLEDARPDPLTLANTQLPLRAKAALAAVSLQIPEEHRDAAFDQIRKDLRHSLLIDAGREAGLALVRATQLEVLDAREELVDSLLADGPIPRVEPYHVADLLTQQPGLRKRIVQAAVAGSMTATQTLLWADASTEPSDEVKTLATEFTRRAAAIQTYRTQTINGQTQVTRIMGANFAPGGLAARFAEEDAAAAFVDRVTSVAVNDEETESNRASAVTGLFNCSSRLTAAERKELWALLTPICRGEYKSITFGSPNPDALSNVQFTSNEPGSLHAAALAQSVQ
jgi:hypothetical protein